MPKNEKTLNIRALLEVEKEIITARRKFKGLAHTDIESDSLGIALSGGGIRSATVCLGIMEQFHKVGLIKKADYLSSVSGGGYLASYIHATLNGKEAKGYEQLFSEEDLAHIQSYRRYLMVFPSISRDQTFFKWEWLDSKLRRLFNILAAVLNNAILLAVAAMATVLSWLWLIVPIFLYYFFSDTFWASSADTTFYIFLPIGIGFLLGVFFSPNWTSPHWFYKSRLRSAFLKNNKSIRLKDLQNKEAPYPIINTAVHVDYDYDQSEDIAYRGRINSNYFLLSPDHCGSQVTCYTTTDSSHFNTLSLATAMATSAAAVNTFMGNFRLAAPIRALMVMLNLRTGILAPNPKTKWKRYVFWPLYAYNELLGVADTDTSRIQISDGGHIENLAVYELLRRRVKTIIAIDAGEDSTFNFYDLRNLSIRARNELGAIITFHENAKLAHTLAPDWGTGLSRDHFVVATISGLPGSYAEGYKGCLVFIKSTVLPKENFTLRKLKKAAKELGKASKKDLAKQMELERLKDELNKEMYRTYTPTFPHESTSDQFFDKSQWDAYYDLGKGIGKKVLGDIGVGEDDGGLALFDKCMEYYERY